MKQLEIYAFVTAPNYKCYKENYGKKSNICNSFMRFLSGGISSKFVKITWYFRITGYSVNILIYIVYFYNYINI